MLRINSMRIYCGIVLRLMPQNTSHAKSKLIQVMAYVVKQQTNTWAISDPNLCGNMVSLGHKELTGIARTFVWGVL